jgi:hypothetical protein
MRSHRLLVAALGLTSLVCWAQTPPPSPKPATAPLPQLQKNGAVTQMFVDGKPYIMFAGELHNSSASSVEYMTPIWKKLATLNLNTVIGTASWELVEPVEGKFDFSLVDYQIREARRNNMRLVLIWFASWKNAVASYVPLWVKKDLKRFPRVQKKDGVNYEELSAFGEASLAADAKAFRALMRHIRESDPQHTVIMMQVENEPGVLRDTRDRSPLAEAAWNRPVPAELMKYLQEHKADLVPELAAVWGATGFRASGTWTEVFGATDSADEAFMAWHIGRYIGKVAEAGKAELKIPMYANAWLPATDAARPGAYPSGGPIWRVMDIWKAAAPQLDLLAPDIYRTDFQVICSRFARPGNPLFIPESRADVPNLLWAIGHHAALGYSPFGIESLNDDNPLGPVYQVLRNMIPTLAKAQAEGKIVPVLQGEERSQTISLGGYKILMTFAAGGRSGQPVAGRGPAAAGRGAAAGAGQPVAGRGLVPGLGQQQAGAYGLILNTAPDEFLFVGRGITATFETDSPGPKIARIGSIDEGRFEHGKWIAGRRINGDENGGGVRLMLRGQSISLQKILLYRHD